MRLITTFPWIVLVTATAHSLLAEVYSVKDLGTLTDLSGRTEARANAINSKGIVAGANVANGAYRALVYGGSWTNLGTLGGTESLAAGINDSNQVVGYASTASGATHGFLWTPGGTDGVASNPEMKDLGTLGGSTSQAFGINLSGQVTGYSDVSTQPTGQQHAFLYSGKTMKDIGKLLTGLPNSFGYGINASGHIAGTAYDAGYGQPHAFFYDGTTAVDIGTFGGQGAMALGINDQDHMVGYLTTTNSLTHAFHYFDGVMTDLGTLGGDYSYGIGINNSDVIVGGSYADANNESYHAFIWAGNSMQDLNLLLDASGAGWTLMVARAISDSGLITGIGTYGGTSRTFLLSPTTTGLPAPEITGITLSGSDLVIRFKTVTTALYSVQTTGALPSSTWSNSVTGIVGNGGTLSATISGAGTRPRQFYRVQASAQ